MWSVPCPAYGFPALRLQASAHSGCAIGGAAVARYRAFHFVVAEMKSKWSNNCVQATPNRALLFIVAQVSGAPDAERWQ
jgi:hypothetical protein